MADLADGDTTEVQGSGSSVYTLKNSGGVYSCTCPAWRNQSLGLERRTCKHLRAYRGDEAENERLRTAELPGQPTRAPRAPGESGGGEEAEAPPVLLAHKWEVDIDISGWWLSEKLDGVRAYWDGKQFLSRLGNRFYPPPWFVEGFPDHPLDGELWGGRKLFQRTVGIVKRQDESPLWEELLYVVFDAPAHGGAFEERLEHAKTVIGKMQYARVHEHYVCTGHDHLKSELARVEGLGGEGLMARKPKSEYEAGRSHTLLKVKSFKDAEARVVDHAPGAGRHKGRLGALIVELADGTRFNVGTGFSDDERESPPEIGAIITFRYQELSDGGVPRFPSYVGVRLDADKPSHLVVERSATEHLGRPQAPSVVAPIVKPVAPKLVKPIASAQTGVRRFEMQDDEGRYFWEIERDGDSHRVRYGTFEVKVKLFESEEESAESLVKRIEEKLAKGFVEI